MFSTATVTALLFALFFVGLGIMIWIDGKKTYILAPKYNHSDGDQESSGENAPAEQDASTKTGVLTAKASSDGNGKALAWSELGFEYEHLDKTSIKMILDLKFSYQFDLQADNDAAKVNTKIESYLNSDNVKIIEQSLPLADKNKTLKESKKITKSQRHIVILKSGEKFTAVIKATAEVESIEGGTCAGSVSATLEEITYRPELQPM